MIKKEGTKYSVWSESGKKRLGKPSSKKQALKRLRQVEYFKHHPEKSIEEKSASYQEHNRLYQTGIGLRYKGFLEKGGPGSGRKPGLGGSTQESPKPRMGASTALPKIDFKPIKIAPIKPVAIVPPKPGTKPIKVKPLSAQPTSEAKQETKESDGEFKHTQRDDLLGVETKDGKGQAEGMVQTREDMIEYDSKLKKVPYENPFKVETIMVDPSEQGKGTGRKLMAEIEGAARKQGSDGVYLNASPMGGQPLDKLLKFYIKNGYKVINHEGNNAVMHKPLTTKKSIQDAGLNYKCFIEQISPTIISDHINENETVPTQTIMQTLGLDYKKFMGFVD